VTGLLPGLFELLAADTRIELPLGRFEDIRKASLSSELMMRKRNGFRRWWSGAREAARTSSWISSSVGPGAVRCRGGVERLMQRRCSSFSPFALASDNSDVADSIFAM
jgi:hypothetical protein